MTPLIFDWAKRTPDRTAMIYNGRPWPYRTFANAIAVARGYVARRGYVGPGYAALFCDNQQGFWVFSLALPNMRGVITIPGEPWAGLLESRCIELGLRLESVSLAGEAPLALDASQPIGGHILLTSGTTGIPKMVVMSADRDAGLARLHGGLLGMNQHTVFSVFHYTPWTGLCYKWAISAWTVGGAVLIEKQPQASSPRRYCAPESPMR